MRKRSGVHTFAENLAKQKSVFEAQLAVTPPGPERDAILNKIQGIENAAHMDGWLRSEIRPPD